MLRTLLRPSVFLPILLAAALIFFLLSLADLPEVFSRIRRISWGAMASCGALAAGYVVVKGTVLRGLLRGLGYRTRWRGFLLAYAIGELAVTVPSGVYAQNYVLSRLGAAPPGHSSAATTLMILVETITVMVALALLGIPGWGWVRPLMGVLVAGHIGAIILVVNSAAVRRWLRSFRGRLVGPLAHGVLGMITGVRQLGTFRQLFPATVLTSLYLSFLGVGLLVIAHATGLSGLTLVQALSIYFVALWVTLLVGSILTQLGVIEAMALGAAQAYGFGLEEALAAILGFRVVWIGSVWILCGGLALFLR
ncbi:MAG TPA: lysylphosphatidylglycerol synthase domain-containing protein, partial [Gammaproteobacteria bacterium]|nr:lysylphosphatidylglycerol synthase domain-containing protein [Gammaproteobacteria bacterium]